MKPTPPKNAFHWQGKPQIIDAMGRIKTERQILLDGQRVNQYSDSARSTGRTKSSTAPR